MPSQKKNAVPTHYRILKTTIPDGASGAGHRFESVCIESAYHATIVRWEWDGKLDRIENVRPCDCKDHWVFPELLAALKGVRRRRARSTTKR